MRMRFRPREVAQSCTPPPAGAIDRAGCEDAAVTKPAAALTALFALLCAMSAALQYNDPDPWRWVAIYLGCGAAAVLALVRPRRWPVAAGIALIAAAWAVWLWAGVSGHVAATDFWRKMSEKCGKVEEMREAGGLTIVAFGAAWAALAARRRARGRAAG
jgi:hypothetical protein